MLQWLLSFVMAAGLAAASAAAQAPRLASGTYIWHPELSGEGPVVVVVSLDEQRAYVYRNGIAIGVSPISSGRKGHETPAGVYTILQKERDHRSNLYDDAPMPFMERLTWDGIALHAGSLPGYPASHGCVRLPHEFAEKLFAITHAGDTVVVASSNVMPAAIVHPAMLAPIGRLAERRAPDAFDAFDWDAGASPDGPVSVLVSLADRTVYVLRNGIRIGRAPLEISEDQSLSGTLVFVIAEGFDEAPSVLDPGQRRHRFTLYPIGADPPASIDGLADRVRVAGAFARLLYPILTPGTTIVVTSRPGVRAARTPDLETVLDAAGAATR